MPDIANTANAPAADTSLSLSKMLNGEGVEQLSGNDLLRDLSLFGGKLSKSGLGTVVSTEILSDAIAEYLRRHGLTSELRGTMVENAMRYLEGPGPVTLGSLRVLDSNLRLRFGEPGRIEVALPADLEDPDDLKDWSDIHGRFNDMFGRDGVVAFKKFATAALGGLWDGEISKAGGDHEGMIKVAFTGRNGEGQFEFFLDDAEHRIVCGDDFAARAEKGDAGLKQVTELLTALVQNSKDHALDRAVFKVPDGVDTHSLLSNDYGASSERQIFSFIMKMALMFEKNEVSLEEAMNEEETGEEETEEETAGEKAAGEARKIIEDVVRELGVLKTQRAGGEIVEGEISDSRFAQFAALVRNVGDDKSRVEGQEEFVIRSGVTCEKDVMKIANIKFRVNIKKLQSALESRGAPGEKSDAQYFGPVIRAEMDQHEDGRVPLGRLLSNLVSNMTLEKDRFFDVAYVRTRELQAHAAARQQANG